MPSDSTLYRTFRQIGPATLEGLWDFAPPYGVRELAARSGASAATLSRTIGLLEREALVESDERGAVVDIDWAGTIRRWSQDYDVLRSNDSVGYLQPRGLASLTEMLKVTKLPYALTGSLAATELAPIAPARLGMVYVDDARAASAALDLREVDAGAKSRCSSPTTTSSTTVRSNGGVCGSSTPRSSRSICSRAPAEGRAKARRSSPG